MTWNKIKEFILYSGASCIALVVDLAAFAVLINLIFFNLDDRISIILATVIARIISGVVNFKLSKKVFDSKNLKKTAILKYFALGGIQLLSSAGLVIVFSRIIKILKTIIKFVVDIVLYVLFYQFQLKFVFRNKNAVEV